ncbi:hypothetical protein CCP4SC76_5050007 [Gammaproteobacteria bacterium]
MNIELIKNPVLPLSAPILRVSHYGTIHIGDLAFDAVVLEDGTRGYIQNQLTKAIGFIKKNRGTQERDFLTKFAPNYMKENDNSDLPEVVKMPQRGYANIFKVGILSELPMNVIEAALKGELHHTQKHIVPHCMAIVSALAKVGEVALIDEATGYQYHREPDALQDFISKILRQTCATWERRFHPDYYCAVFGLFGWQYHGIRGRTASYPAAPAQIPACGTTAPGSSKLLASHVGINATQKL